MRKTIIGMSAAGLLAISLPWKAYSLGLGEITLKSGLNQSFQAEIALHAVRETPVEDIHVKLASDEAFAQAGIERALGLSKFRFRPLRKETGETVVEITSQRPVHVPFLDFLVTITWPQGHVLREYTVLLDPPSLSKLTSNGQGITELFPSRQAETTASSISIAGEPLSVYGPVQPSDTLWAIAQRIRADFPSVALHQMMSALQRANPDAFLHNNANGLIVGKKLRVPSKDEMLKFSNKEAIERIQQQNKAWAALFNSGMGLENQTPEVIASEQMAPEPVDASSQEKENFGIRPQEVAQQVAIPQQLLPAQNTNSAASQESLEALPGEQQTTVSSPESALAPAVEESKVATAVGTMSPQEGKAAEEIASASIAAADAPGQVKPVKNAPVAEVNESGGILDGVIEIEIKNLLVAGESLLLLIVAILWLRKRKMAARSASTAATPRILRLKAPAGEVINSLVFLPSGQEFVTAADTSSGIKHSGDTADDMTETYEIIVEEEEFQGQDFGLKATDDASASTALNTERNFEVVPEDSSPRSLNLEEEDVISPPPGKIAAELPTMETETPDLEFDLGVVDLSRSDLSYVQAPTESADDRKEDGSLDFDLSDFPIWSESENPSDPESHAADELASTPESTTHDNKFVSLESTDFSNPGAIDEGNDSKAAQLSTGKSLLDDLNEMEVKLDLAKVYMDMGDLEEAHGILEEVFVNGSKEQRDVSQELLEQLAKAS